MNRPRWMPVWLWMPLTWAAHVIIQFALYRLFVLSGVDGRWCAIALPIWFIREGFNLYEKWEENGRITKWDLLDTVGDLAGPIAITIWSWQP